MRALLSLSGPIILANLLQTTYQLADAFWVGRLGAEAIAAVSLSFLIIFLTIALGGGFAIAGKTDRAERTTWLSAGITFGTLTLAGV